MDLLYFLLLVSVLIFVHELGHFVVAKVFGVKVLTFSIGFGPKLLRFRGRETEYCVAVVPLGGFVKMLEASRGDEVLPEDVHRTFEAQALWKRALVVMAGPTMNLLFPVLLYAAVFAGDRSFAPPVIGQVLAGHPAEGKLIEGDRILAVNDREIGTFSELQHEIMKHPKREVRLRIFRNLGYLDARITPEEVIEDVGFQHLMPVGRLGVLPHPLAAAIGISRTESPAYRAGLRTFDVITSIGGRPARVWSDVEIILADNRGETVPVTYLRPVFLEGALGGYADMAVYEAGLAALTPDATQGDLLGRTGMESPDLFVAFVPPGSAQAKADIQRGDRLIELDDQPLLSWNVLVERLFAEKEKAHKLTYVREGKRDAGSVELRHEFFTDDTGQSHDRYALRMGHWAPTMAEPRVEHPHAVRYALGSAVDRTWEVARFLTVSLSHMLRGHVGVSQLSGPLAIYEVAGKEGAKGADYFLWIMAILSINLGLLNLLPIPILDGGHLMFLWFEAMFRKPLPLRVRELASLIGMIFLVGLMAMAFKNDLQRRWPAITGQLHELFG